MNFLYFLTKKIVGVSFKKVRDEVEKDLGITDIKLTDLQDDIIGPIFIEEYRNQVTKRMKDDKCMLILAGYTKCVFQDFESYLGTKVDLIEGDVRLVLDEYNSSFITYELQQGIYSFKDIPKLIFVFSNPNIQHLTR